jgi:hypothetical protein
MPPDEAPMALYHRKKLKMKLTLLVLACFAVPSIIMGAIHGASPPPTAPPAGHLTIAQTAATQHAGQRLEAQIEAANIESAFNRALRDVGSQTRLREELSDAKVMCFQQSIDFGRGTHAENSIACAHAYAEKYPGIELMVFARMP